jgi:pimeloyl-ACP methyl ester carboxylesterase
LETSAPDVKIFLIGSSFGGGLAYNAACEVENCAHAFLLAPVFDYFLDVKRSAPDWKRDIEVDGFIRYSTLKLSPSIIAEAEQFDSIVDGCELAATIFHGTRDDDVPIESSRLICATHPNFELVEVEGAGHVMSEPGDWDMESEQSWLFVKRVLMQIGDRMNVAQYR